MAVTNKNALQQELMMLEKNIRKAIKTNDVQKSLHHATVSN